jgi:hypothetical protein
VVSASTDLARALKDELQSRARSAFLEVIKDIDAAQLFLESTTERGQAHRSLVAQYRAATPRLAVKEGWQHVFLALPAGKDGASLAYMFSQTFPEVQATLLDSEGDVILCQEFAHVPLRQVAASLIEDEAVYADHIKRVLTRMDITWSPLTPTALREGVSK